MPTVGDIVKAINELPADEREDRILTLVTGLTVSANAADLAKYAFGEADTLLVETSKASRRTSNHIIKMLSL